MKTKPIYWIAASYEQKAMREGWGLFDMDGRFHIEKIDNVEDIAEETAGEIPQLASDEEALSVVIEKASQGSKPHAFALWLNERSVELNWVPDEFLEFVESHDTQPSDHSTYSLLHKLPRHWSLAEQDHWHKLVGGQDLRGLAEAREWLERNDVLVNRTLAACRVNDVQDHATQDRILVMVLVSHLTQLTAMGRDSNLGS